MAHRFHRSTLVAGILWSEQEQLAQLNRELADATEKYQDLRLRKTAVEVCLAASYRLVVVFITIQSLTTTTTTTGAIAGDRS